MKFIKYLFRHGENLLYTTGIIIASIYMSWLYSIGEKSIIFGFALPAVYFYMMYRSYKKDGN